MLHMPVRDASAELPSGRSKEFVPHRPHEGPPQERERGEESHQELPPTADEYLVGERIVPRRIEPGITVADLIEGSFQAYNAGRINEAARLFAQRMLDPEQDVTICLTIA